MTGWIVRVVVFSAMSIASAIGVWKVHTAVGGQLGAIGGVLGALVAALMLGGLLWIIAVLRRRILRSTGVVRQAHCRQNNNMSL